MQQELIERIKDTRKTIDLLSKKSESVSSLATKSLLMAKAWLGRCFYELGVQSPYVVVNNVADIPKTADTSDYNTELGKTTLEVINALRSEINALIEEFNKLELDILEIYTYKVKQCFEKCWEYLVESSVELGFKLGELRDGIVLV
jgi:hypothetical protein